MPPKAVGAPANQIQPAGQAPADLSQEQFNGIDTFNTLLTTGFGLVVRNAGVYLHDADQLPLITFNERILHIQIPNIVQIIRTIDRNQLNQLRTADHSIKAALHRLNNIQEVRINNYHGLLRELYLLQINIILLRCNAVAAAPGLPAGVNDAINQLVDALRNKSRTLNEIMVNKINQPNGIQIAPQLHPQPQPQAGGGGDAAYYHAKYMKYKAKYMKTQF